jgi:3-oxoacyl-[acyl-carrier protein] reductase
VADSSPQRCDSVASDLAKIGGDVHRAVCVDVRDPSQIKSFFDLVATNLGQLDVLVNNAAIVPHFSWGLPRWPPIREMEFEHWSDVMDTNVDGVFLCTHHALGLMVRGGGGHVINVHGGNRQVKAGHCAYAVSKQACLALTRYVAEEEREHGICVLSISPGGQIASEEAPTDARDRLPGPDSVGERFLLAANADMSLSGHLVDLVDGKLVVVDE